VVTAVVCTAFAAADDDAVFAVREAVRAAGIVLPDRPPHRPHLTLSAARVERDAVDEVTAVASAVAARHTPVPLLMSEVGRFGRAGALWLGPASSPALVALQHDVTSALAQRWPPAFGERSDPSGWVPHCTLATRVPKPQLRAVQDVVRASFEPFPATVVGLATILVGGRGDVGYAPLTG